MIFNKLQGTSRKTQEEGGNKMFVLESITIARLLESVVDVRVGLFLQP